MPNLDYTVSPKEFAQFKHTKEKSPRMALIAEFIKSNKPFAEITFEENEYASASSAYCIFKDAITRMNLKDTVKLYTRKGRLFIMRKDKEND